MRLLIVPLCLALAGCLTSPDPAPSSEQPAAAPAASTAAPASAPAPASQPRANQALRGSSPPPKPRPPELDPQYTPEQRVLLIRQVCWSDADKQKQLRGNLDGRVAWVEKCIATKTNESAAVPSQPAPPAR